jgi:hypothetical protein
LKADDAYSENARNNTKHRFASVLVTRLNFKAGGQIFVVSQRPHEDDLSGMLIERGWDKVVLPAIAPCDTVVKLGNRTHLWRAGEPLQAREPFSVLEDARRDMTEATFAA